MTREDLKPGMKFIYRQKPFMDSTGEIYELGDRIIGLKWFTWHGFEFNKVTTWPIGSALELLDFKTPEYKKSFEEILK